MSTTDTARCVRDGVHYMTSRHSHEECPTFVVDVQVSDASDTDHPPYKVPTYEGEDYTTQAICEGIYALWDSQGTHGSLDGDDPLGDNIKRAKKASDAIEVYAEASGLYEGEHILLAIGDLMSDLRHLLDFVGLTEGSEAADGNVTDLELIARRDLHYEAEIRGEL